MQKWEFLEIHVRVSTSKLRVTVHGKIPEANSFDNEADLAQYLNSLGAEGWELVNADNNEYGFKNYFFKRPVE